MKIDIHLIILTNLTTRSFNYEALNHLDIPNNNGNIAISVHTYELYSWTIDSSESHKDHSNNKYSSCNLDTLNIIMNDFTKIQSEKILQLLSVNWVPQISTIQTNALGKRVHGSATSIDFLCVLWDNNADNDYSSSESFGFISRSTNKLYDSFNTH